MMSTSKDFIKDKGSLFCNSTATRPLLLMTLEFGTHMFSNSSAVFADVVESASKENKAACLKFLQSSSSSLLGK